MLGGLLGTSRLYMLSAKRKSDGQIVTAYFSSKSHGPFTCPQCSEEVVLKTGRNRIDHFAHANPIACRFAEGESDLHRACKLEIFEALKGTPDVDNVALEKPIGMNRADVSADIRGVRVAIEVQISSLSLDTILERTIEYGRNGVYVLWLLQWTPGIDVPRYAPRFWEKWIHACYFGQVYYWTHDLSVVSYHFNPHFKMVPKKMWYTKDDQKMTAGGYSRRSIRYRSPVRGPMFNIATDFVPKQRYWWVGEGVTVPDAKLFIAR